MYSPKALIVPTVEFPPATPFTFQLTAVFVVPVTVATNVCVLAAGTEELLGATVTEILEGVSEEDEPEPPHPVKASSSNRMGSQHQLRIFNEPFLQNIPIHL